MQKDNQIISTQIENLQAKHILNEFSDLKANVKEVIDLLKTSKPLEFLTIKEVSQFLKVSKVTIHNWTKQGILKPYKIGNQTRFKRLEVLQALNLKANKL